MDQYFSINKIYPQKMKFSPAFASRISKPAIKTITETTLKTYSTAIAAMGITGIALGKEENVPTEITANEFMKVLGAKNVPVKYQEGIADLCLYGDRKVSSETVSKILQIIDLTDENDFWSIGINLTYCFEKSKLSQLALDSYIDYLKIGMPAVAIHEILLECSQDSDDTFSPVALNSAKKLFEKGVSALDIQYLVMYSKDKNGDIKDGFFEQLDVLVDSLIEKGYIKDVISFIKLVRDYNAETSIQVMKIINRLVKEKFNSLQTASYLDKFNDNEQFLEQIIDYSEKSKTPMWKLKRHPFHSMGTAQQCFISMLIQIEGMPYLIIKSIMEDMQNKQITNNVYLGLMDLINKTQNFPLELLNKIFTKTWMTLTPKSDIPLNRASQTYNDFLEMKNITQTDIKILTELRNRVLANPDLYVNGDGDTTQISSQIWQFFINEYIRLKDFINIFDKETTDVLLRRRLAEAEEYTGTLALFDEETKELLKKVAQSNGVDGRQLLPTQKIEFIDLLYAYQSCKIPTDRLQKMIEQNCIDIDALELELFKKIMTGYGITERDLETVPKEKLDGWNLKYIHLLSKEIEESGDYGFIDIIKSSLFADFDKYIHDTTYDCGVANSKTKQIFGKIGLDYEKWVKPNKDLEVRFQVIDNNAQQLELMAKQTEEDIESLLENPALRSLLHKRFSQNMQKGYFTLKSENYTSKKKFSDFLNNLNNQLEDVWKRAENNKGKNPKALSTLAIRDHIEERLKALANFKEDKTNKSLDWTIKMWDRVPQKDLFQGNYSTCCIGIGRGFGEYMPTYLMNTAFNMIEILDNATGKTVGNALCYFVKDKDGNPAFVIDNVEINNSMVPSDENSLKLRDMLVEYISKLTEDISERKEVPIYLSPNYNDIYCDDLQTRNIKMSFLGDIDRFDIYLDMYHDGGAQVTIKDELIAHNLAYKLK